MQPSLVEQIFLDLIKPYNQRDLQYAIDREVSLAKLIGEYLNSMLFMARLLAKIYKQQVDLLNYDNVMRWLEMERPDLYDVIGDRQVNKNWLRKQIEEVKELLF